MWLQFWARAVRKDQITLANAVPKGITDTSQPDGKMKYKSIADRWDRDHVHRANLETEGKIIEDALTWDAAIAMFDKETTPVWSGERIQGS